MTYVKWCWGGAKLCLHSMWMGRWYMLAAVPILIPAFYLLLPSAASPIGAVINFTWTYGGGKLTEPRWLPAVSLAKIMEISVGVNLALSFIEEFGSFALGLATRVVEKLNPKNNPTLAEAVTETAQWNAQQFGGVEFHPEKLAYMFFADLTEQMAKLDGRLKFLLGWVKRLGYMTALLSYAILVRVEVGEETGIPAWVAHSAWIGAAFPVFLHVAGSLVLSAKCRWRMMRPNNHGVMYQAFFKEAMRNLASKSKTLSSPDLVGR
jgi:hypothetical protein